jgi:DNA polymerase I-like protein with 3'-5' exonuclease and polymerase domains
LRELKSIRETFLPDPGCIFVKADLSQVEDRMGKMYCGSKRMVELANLPPWEYDCHTDNASTIFGVDITTLPKDEFKQKRYLGKKVVHASWRQMAGGKMSESVSKDTDGKVFIPPKKCQTLIDTYLEKILKSLKFISPGARIKCK